MCDLSKKEQEEQKKAAELQAVEKISSEIIPCPFHDAEDRSWATIREKDHWETYAIDSPQMRKHLEGLYYQETKRNSGQGEAIPDKLLKKTLNRLRVMALHDGEEKKVTFRKLWPSDRTLSHTR